MKPRDFHSLRDQGFVRVAVCTPRVRIADPVGNARETMALLAEGSERKADLLVFPELGLSGYAIDDLLLQDALLDAVEEAIASVLEATRRSPCVAIVGAPVRRNGRLYNAAVILSRGSILGVVPKSFLPNYREFYENRWFAAGAGLAGLDITLAGVTAPFGTDLVFAAADRRDFTFHVEICEDVWSATPPSSNGALAGALILCNLSASNVVVGKADDRALLCASQSMRCQAAYAYAAAGPGESTTDLAWDGQASIHELGHLLVESSRFPSGSRLCTADVDVERLRLERMRTGTFNNAAVAAGLPEFRFRRVVFEHPDTGARGALDRTTDRFPFVPADDRKLDRDCYEAFNIQVQGLVQRIEATGVGHVVIGVSGGLDSTHALLVVAKAFDALGRPRSDILGFTMPGFATSDETKANAWALMNALGVTGEEIDIRPTASRLLHDIGHPFSRGEPVYDITFENVQAGMRTDFLFRLANQRNGLVVGTGDLSELALGWCTYGVGDQMSHYNVNGSIAKTLIQHLVRWVAASGQLDGRTSQTLHAILATKISPELVPAAADGTMQSTEATIGPFELHDFFLFYISRFGMRPSKVAYLAWQAWGSIDRGSWPRHFPDAQRRVYTPAEIKRWLRVFLHRFFQFSQFKRSAMPNGPKVVSGGSLSPRGDWRAPSDASATTWLAELDANVPEEEDDDAE